MSEESSTDGPEPAAVPQAEPGPAPGPRRRGRRNILVLTGIAVISVAMVAATVVWSVAFAPSKAAHYSDLPEPCTLLSWATLDRYLPGATATPETLPATSVTGPTGVLSVKDGLCLWSSTSGGENRTVQGQVLVFVGPLGATFAQQYYGNAVSLNCHCRGVTIGTQPVTGLGDQAVAQFLTVGPDASFSTAADATVPGSASSCGRATP